MRKITREEVQEALNDDLAAELQKGVPTEIEMAVKKFLDSFDREYRQRLARSTGRR